MSAFTMSKVSSAVQTRVGAYGLSNRRWLHGSLKRNAILMPAMSPLMTEGTITRWKKKEGDAFAAGEVLLQIQSDLYAVDVEAQCPGILGKILMPDGTSNVPVEQVIALVARDTNELSLLQNQSSSDLSISPTFNFPQTPSASKTLSPTSPRHLGQFNKPLSSPRTPTMTLRTPSLFEMHTMGYGHRSVHVGGPRGGTTVPDLISRDVDLAPCPSPRIQQQKLQQEDLSVPLSPARWPMDDHQETAQMDGAAIRRMIVSNLSSSKTTELDELF